MLIAFGSIAFERRLRYEDSIGAVTLGALGVTEREADVLRLVALGLGFLFFFLGLPLLAVFVEALAQFLLRQGTLDELAVHRAQRAGGVGRLRIDRRAVDLAGQHRADQVFVWVLRIGPAFVNGLLIRYLDFNDTYLSKEPAHPSDNIAPVLAAGQA